MLQIGSLQTMHLDTQGRLQDVIDANTQFNNATNDRQEEFKGVKELATRMIDAFEASCATPEKLADAKVFNRKLHGKRAKATISPVDGQAPAPKTISVSQQSFDQIVHDGLRFFA